MKFVFLLGGILLLAPAVASPALAAGCVRGAVVGGVLGHMAGHGMVGAAAGCAIGHHEANKHDRYDDNRYNRDGDRRTSDYPR
jgi:hypothetical protein